jgi:hypothetical protein
MNPLKTLFNKVFESTPQVDATIPPKGETAFEWNPDAETVAPTSSRAASWRRGDTPDPEPPRTSGERTRADLAASSLPQPTFERSETKTAIVEPPPAEPARARWNEAPASVPSIPAASSVDDAPFISVKAVTPPLSAELSPPSASTPAAPSQAPPLIPVSDFEDVYRKAGIKSPVHGYGVERVYRLLTSRRLVGLDRNVRRSALLTALDAAGVPASDVSQDAVLRGKALTAFEAEKALELQSLRSRNESRAEALQDTVETFNRQKQSQIERLAQGSTSAVRAQSDLEIRKRMEQDRLFRSLAYFVEPLPSPVSEVRGAFAEAPRVIERFDATIEMSLSSPDEYTTSADEVQALPKRATAPEPEAEVLTATPEEIDPDTRPVSLSGMEAALRAAAEEARTAGWGRPAIVEDGAGDAGETLRKLRDGQKTESGS